MPGDSGKNKQQKKKRKQTEDIEIPPLAFKVLCHFLLNIVLLKITIYCVDRKSFVCRNEDLPEMIFHMQYGIIVPYKRDGLEVVHIGNYQAHIKAVDCLINNLLLQIIFFILSDTISPICTSNNLSLHCGNE